MKKKREWLPLQKKTKRVAAITDIQRSRVKISAIFRETKLEDVGCLLVLQIESGFSLIFFYF